MQLHEIETALASYRADVRRMSVEAQRATRFAAALTQIFGAAVGGYIASMESRIECLPGANRRTGRMDAHYGNLVIEFKRGLNREQIAAGKAQIRDYAAGLRERYPGLSLVCALTDGITWRIYVPFTPAAKPAGKTPLELKEASVFEVTSDNLKEFYFWLDRLFVRQHKIAPTSDNVRRDFGSASAPYLQSMASLREAFQSVKDHPEVLLAYEQWRNYLTVVYGESVASEDLFLRHTYLFAFSRFLLDTALEQPGGQPRGQIEQVIGGEAFTARGLANLDETGFFHWILWPDASRKMAVSWHRLKNQLGSFDFDNIQEDILKSVYQDLVDPDERHDLGEYYTPDWLAAMVVRELLAPHKASGRVPVMLDPSCGSGTFLRAAIAALASTPEFPEITAETVTRNIIGFDVHPLAVQIARATYALALRGRTSQTGASLEIPVYLADSLRVPLPMRQAQLTLSTAGDQVPLRFHDRHVDIPRTLLEKPHWYDQFVVAAEKLSVTIVQNKPAAASAGGQALAKSAPDLAAHKHWKEISAALTVLARELAELKIARQNSLWAFILRNLYRPAIFAKQFDIVMGNPPWLSYRYIRDPAYQKIIASLADAYGLAMSGKLRTHLEIAVLFLLYSADNYLKNGGTIGFVMPRGIFTADQYDTVRRQRYKNAECQIAMVWDLDAVEPLFNVPSCVVFGRHAQPKMVGDPPVIPCLAFEGKLPVHNASPEMAAGTLQKREQKLYFNTLAQHSCWYHERIFAKRVKPSPYDSGFKQGATIVPRNYYFVDEVPTIIPMTQVASVRTNEDMAMDAKPPYKRDRVFGLIEREFLFPTVTAQQLLPFHMLAPKLTVLPIIPKAKSYEVWSADKFRSEGYRHITEWLDKIETLWRGHRGLKGSSATQWLDYRRKLSAQNPSVKHFVLYGTSGTHVAAAAWHARKGSSAPIVDTKCYYLATATKKEADFIVGVLNARIVNDSIKPFQSRGLMGARDIHTKVLKLPIPRFDPENKRHQKIADLSAAIAGKVETFVVGGGHTALALGRMRTLVRAHIKPELAELDALVRQLLGI